MNSNHFSKSASNLMISIFNPFNISQLYFAFLDYRFSSPEGSQRHLINLSANNIGMMLVLTALLFFVSSYVLELRHKVIQ